MDSKTLFTNPYDERSFLIFMRKFLGDEFEDGEKRAISFGGSFKFLTGYRHLGSIMLDNDGIGENVLILEIDQISFQDARVSITKEAIKLIKSNANFAGYFTVLVIFKSPKQSDNWRFSLIKSNDGKSWNNARRFSYYLGKNEGYKTPKQYLVDAGQVKDLKDLVSRFDVEVVRKEFFNLYINLFLELYQEVKKYQYCFRSVNNGSLIDLVSFSKNLMGKMIFLYFIQKKGWLGLTADQNFKDHPGKHNFFKENFENQTLARDENLFQGGVNFYNDFLEPLFYSGLNKKNPNDWHEKLQMKVPYLNGGLFEEEYKDRETTSLPLENNLFKAIVDAFDTYNFTIDENDPMDQEIAVDPEMLGKIFEYMISIHKNNIDDLVALYNKKKRFDGYPNPDRSVNIVAEIKKNKEINKKLGAFYTPREIVQYMTREALMYSMIEFLSKKLTDKSREELEAIVRELRHCKDKHLTTKDEIEDREGQVATYQTLKSVAFDVKEYLLYDTNSEIKPLSILDPAVGSGAFPMGILQEMTGLVEYLIDTFGLEKKSRYEIKQSIIRDSIYGVDIDPGAVDIARLRFWLSLIVDAHEPIPLPNLEFKFVCANSITPLENDTLFTNSETIIKLRSIKQQYFQTSDYDTKQKLQADFGEAKLELLGFKDHKFRSEFTSLKKFNEYVAELGKQASDAKNKQFNSWEPFDTTVSNKWFDSSMMFDTDKFDIVIGNPPYIQLQKAISENNKTKYGDLYENKGYKTFERTGDIYCIFYELGVNHLKEGGNLCYITSNKWMRAGYGESLRKYFTTYTNPLILVDLGPNIFETATVDSNILITQKRKVSEYNLKGLDLVKEKSIHYNIEQYHDQMVDMKNLGSDVRVILSPIEQSIKQKIEKVGTPLKDWDINIYRGILTGFNEAFIISGEKKNELIKKDPKSAEIIRPILRGKDIKRNGYSFADLWLIMTHNGYNNSNGEWVKRVDIIEYPAIKEHLDGYSKELQKRLDQGDTPYNLRSCAYMDDFFKQKIVYSEIVRQPQFYLDTQGEFFVEATSFLMTGENIDYLIDRLNSPIVARIFKRFYAGGGLGEDGYRYKKAFLENLPLPKPNGKNDGKTEMNIYSSLELSDEEIKFISSSLSS